MDNAVTLPRRLLRSRDVSRYQERGWEQVQRLGLTTLVCLTALGASAWLVVMWESHS